MGQIFRIVLASVTCLPPIIIRHDVPEEAYVHFAEELPVTTAVIRYNSSDVAGTLIAGNWILSAAHVAETIRPGQQLITAEGDSVEVEQVYLHPGWVENGRPEDVALVKLTRPITGIPTVDLYRSRDEVGMEVVVIGNGDYGTGRTGPLRNDGKMRAATNRVDDATEDYLMWNFDDPEHFPEKATRLEGISGPGDSGGPAFIRNEGVLLLAGISSGQSTSATNGQEGRYGVTEYYTRVSTYYDWVIETIGR